MASSLKSDRLNMLAPRCPGIGQREMSVLDRVLPGFTIYVSKGLTKPRAKGMRRLTPWLHMGARGQDGRLRCRTLFSAK